MGHEGGLERIPNPAPDEWVGLNRFQIEKKIEAIAKAGGGEEITRGIHTLNELRDTLTEGEQYLQVLRHAIDQAQLEELTFALYRIQNAIHKARFSIEHAKLRPREEELAKLVGPRHESLIMYVRTGTHGDRIWVENGRLSIPLGDNDPQVTVTRFREYFQLAPDANPEVFF